MNIFGKKEQKRAKPSKPSKAKQAPEKPKSEPQSLAQPVEQMESTELLAVEKEVQHRVDRSSKTKLIGFDNSDSRVIDLFDEEALETAQSGRCQFPVAWIIVVSGPGRGECFALKAGMSQIGRGEDQAVSLNFGDMAVSRSNHAAIVYDPGSQRFLLGHGGKANIVRLNGVPVVSTSDLGDGDFIEIGETRMQLKTLCSKAFSWSTGEDEGDDDVEIA